MLKDFLVEVGWPLTIQHCLRFLFSIVFRCFSCCCWCCRRKIYSGRIGITPTLMGSLILPVSVMLPLMFTMQIKITVMMMTMTMTTTTTTTMMMRRRRIRLGCLLQVPSEPRASDRISEFPRSLRSSVIL